MVGRGKERVMSKISRGRLKKLKKLVRIYDELDREHKLEVMINLSNGMNMDHAIEKEIASFNEQTYQRKTKPTTLRKKRVMCNKEAKTKAHFGLVNAARERANGGTHTQYESNTKIQQVRPLKHKGKAINHQANIDLLAKAGIK